MQHIDGKIYMDKKGIQQNFFHTLVLCACCDKATTRSHYLQNDGLCFTCKTSFKQVGLI